MTLNRRRFTLPAHGVIEFVLGIITLFSPALFGFGHSGVVVAILFGSLLIGMAVTVSADHGSSFGWHHLFDMTFVIATAIAAFGLAVAGEATAAVFLAALAIVQSGLNLATRYVAVR
jgi:uncharacterized membrane protein HdeD (DUF308 family)